MMQFNVNGQFLELPDNFSVQFKKTNVLFAFDKAECERSASFSIPATPKNDAIFNVARWVQASGDGMRRRYDAQLQASGVTKDGYLYVDSYSKGEYKAVFVTGELLGLQALRAIGDISKCGIFDDYKVAVDASAAGMGAYNGRSELWANVYYRQTDGQHPSLGIAPLLSAMGITDTQGVIANTYLRIISADPKTPQDESIGYNILFKNRADGQYVPVGQQAFNVSYMYTEDFLNEYFFENAMLDGGARVLLRYTSGGTAYHGYLTQKKTRNTTEIWFLGGVDGNVFMGYFDPQNVGQEYSSLSDFHFLGGYEFDAQGNVTGTPLTDRSVTIPAGTTFCFIKKSWWTADGWNVATPDLSLQVAIIFSDLADNPPQIWRLIDNLPTCTPTDLLKAIAAMNGAVLNYTEQDGIRFEFNLLDGAVLNITGEVIETTDTKRKFSDYEQHNIVEYKADKNLLDYESISVDYTIDSDNLKEQKTLLSMPAGCGGMYKVAEPTSLMIRGEQAVDVFARYETGDNVYLHRTGLIKLQDIQTLCNASTSVQARARMTLLEFDKITPKTLIYYAGARYVWTEAQWSKGTVTLKLSKT